jgi:hyperosmotically inducible periplasmic protein
MKTQNALGIVCAGLLASASGHGAEEYEGAARDAWLDGKLETAYLFNPELNSFTIDTEVKDGVAYLSGSVESSVDKALAEEIAARIDGVTDVRSTLAVDPDAGRREVPARADTREGDERSFREWYDDATTTAAVKSKLLGHPDTDGLEIDVDTRGDVVTLSGAVESEDEKRAAEAIARETTDVRDVVNSLEVR